MGVVFFMCMIATVYMGSCDSVYIAKWQPTLISCGQQNAVQGTLTTTRIHSPNHKGRYGPTDEVKYDLKLAPLEEADAETDAANTWSPQVAEYLDKQLTRKPMLIFLKGEDRIRVAAVPIVLRKKVAESTTSYYSADSFPYISGMKTCDDWSVIWDIEQPPRPIVRRRAGSGQQISPRPQVGPPPNVTPQPQPNQIRP